MPSTVTTTLLRKNMKKASQEKQQHLDDFSDNNDENHNKNGDADETTEGNYTYPDITIDRVDDAKDGNSEQQQPTGRSIFGRGLKKHSILRKGSFGGEGFTKSDTTLKALSDPNSELAQFLLIDQNEQDLQLVDRAAGKSSMVRGMRSNRVWFYSMSLEPMEVRKERIIMLSEAYAIFGALFLSGTWVLYEWGSSSGYGGCSFQDSFACHAGLDRAFEAIMTMAITSNLFMAMFASFLWLQSVLFSGTHQNWVFGCRHLLVLCHLLLCCVLVLTIGGVGVGIFTKLAPNWPELVIAMCFFLVIVVTGVYHTSYLIATQLPLEYYHFPLWFKWFVVPFPMFSRKSRERIRVGAEQRAKELKARAFRERTALDPSPAHHAESYTPIGKLLRISADNIGKKDHDISQYESRLDKDWYTKIDELKSMSVDILSRYMPRRLADEVHQNLTLDSLNESGGLRSVSIGRGMVNDDDTNVEKRVSWQMESD